MKHIKRKFLNEIELKRKENEAPLHELLGSQDITTEMIDNAEIPKDSVPWLMSDDSIYSGFQVKINGKKKIIPEPDSILVYYSTAYFNYKALDESRKKVIERTKQTIGGESAIDELYEYFGLVSCVVIFLFMTVEGTMNRCIPENYIYKTESSTKTEIYTKEQIERYFTFDKKLKVLNEITNKDFRHGYGIKYQHITNLKNFRDDIIHTKSENQGETASNHNFRRAFAFDFTNAMIAVRDFCNFYLNKDFIVDCPCSKDW